MLGVPVEAQSCLVGDNMAVVVNTTLPSSALKTKHQACNYHRVREAVAAGFVRFGYINSTANLVDIYMKPLYKGAFQRLLSDYMFRNPKSLPKESEE